MREISISSVVLARKYLPGVIFGLAGFVILLIQFPPQKDEVLLCLKEGLGEGTKVPVKQEQMVFPRRLDNV